MIKTEEGGVTVYEVRHAAVQHAVFHEEEFEGCKFRVTAGDYQDLLQKVSYVTYRYAVLRIRIRRIRMFLGLRDPDPDPLAM